MFKKITIYSVIYFLLFINATTLKCFSSGDKNSIQNTFKRQMVNLSTVSEKFETT